MAEEYLGWYRDEEDFDCDHDFNLLFTNSGDKKTKQNIPWFAT